MTFFVVITKFLYVVSIQAWKITASDLILMTFHLTFVSVFEIFQKTIKWNQTLYLGEHINSDDD